MQRGEFEMTIITKPCKYGCGKKVFWNNDFKDSKIKWCEEDTGLLHSYPRCADLLKEQGKNTEVLKKK